MISKEHLQRIVRLQFENSQRDMAEGRAKDSLVTESMGLGATRILMRLVDVIELETGMKIEIPGYNSPKPSETKRQEPQP